MASKIAQNDNIIISYQGTPQKGSQLWRVDASKLGFSDARPHMDRLWSVFLNNLADIVVSYASSKQNL